MQIIFALQVWFLLLCIRAYAGLSIIWKGNLTLNSHKLCWKCLDESLFAYPGQNLGWLNWEFIMHGVESCDPFLILEPDNKDKRPTDVYIFQIPAHDEKSCDNTGNSPALLKISTKVTTISNTTT